MRSCARLTYPTRGLPQRIASNDCHGSRRHARICHLFERSWPRSHGTRPGGHDAVSLGPPTCFICRTCGVQYAPSSDPPRDCIICTDARQYVGSNGQEWTTLSSLAEAGQNTRVQEEEPGLIGIGVDPSIGIGQRSLLLTSPLGNLLWDVPGYVDESAYEAVRSHGGLAAVSASHPHFYGVIAEWAREFDVPILLPEADQRWITRPDDRVTLYEDRVDVTPSIAIIRCGGHFPGSAVVHWTGSHDGRGVLATGDSVSVAQDRGWVSFMWSYPNLIPLDGRELDRIGAALDGLNFDRIYGGWWGRTVSTDAAEAVRRSIERYRVAITDTRSLEP